MGKVLIIEDDANLCDSYTDVLEMLGHEVKTARSGSRAMILLSRFVPDIVILNMELQGSSGTSVLSFLKHNRALAKVRIIGMTISAKPVDRSGEVDVCLLKPVSPAELRAAVLSLETAGC